MKWLLLTCLAGLALALPTVDPVDVDTCAAFKEDGATKGLYGLCIAICEVPPGKAEGCDPVWDKVTGEVMPESVEACRPPSAKLINKFRAKASVNANSPTLPCVVVQPAGTCPCEPSEDVWTLPLAVVEQSVGEEFFTWQNQTRHFRISGTLKECQYLDSVSGLSVSISDLSGEDVAACQLRFRELAVLPGACPCWSSPSATPNLKVSQTSDGSFCVYQDNVISRSLLVSDAEFEACSALAL